MSRTETTIVVDVWGGDGSSEWIARFIRPIDTALEIARQELAAGFLVNLRAEAAFGADSEFDKRSTVQ